MKGVNKYLFAMTVLVGWLAGCSADTDSLSPATGDNTVQLSVIGAAAVTDVIILVFDRNQTLLDIIRTTGNRLDSNSLQIENLSDGTVCFAAVNTAGQYRLIPSNPQPGRTTATDISFEAIGSTRLESDEAPAYCGSAGTGDGPVSVI
ncbi:MAG: hypothetical protein LUE26_02060 [Alistipes sp.]|nr:hypothetical protein [Alistipes sp.]